MISNFYSIYYTGGLPSLDKSCNLDIVIDDTSRTITFLSPFKQAVINFEDIVAVSLYEKSTLLENQVSGRLMINQERDKSSMAETGINELESQGSRVHITYKKNGKQCDIRLKLNRKKESLYSAISSAILTKEPPDFNRKAFQFASDKKLGKSITGVCIFIILVLSIALLIKIL